MNDDGGATFESARQKLMAIAYRMLGSVVEAEDVVGDVAVKWSIADRDAVREPEAWLVTATTRRALDVLGSARVQRETYPGVWLPEPIATGDGPGDDVERAETLTMGFLVLLERLTPIERAVFVLHDVLGYTYAEVAETTGRAEPACRQALHRARQHVTVPAPRTASDRTSAIAVTQQFMLAMMTGNVDALLSVLAPDVVVLSDGGGVVYAALRPVVGIDRSVRFVTNLAARFSGDAFLLACELNGEPAVVGEIDGMWQAMITEVRGSRVAAVRIVRNPAKLERLVASLPGAADRPGPWSTPQRFRHRRGQPAS